MTEENEVNRFTYILKKLVNPSSIQKETTNSKVTLSFWCCILTFIVASYSIAMGLQSYCPSAKYSNKNSPFKETEAYQILKEGTQMSSDRYVGSKANEVHMPKLLMRILNAYNRSGNYSFKVDEQLSNGLTHGPLFFYENIRNIAVRVSDNRQKTNDRKSAILVNCHYDSELGSPGASDNFVNCAVLLEIIRIIYESKPSLQHDIIFLFNGAEERYLTGSHLFVKQHKWWTDVKAFVNLEAAGSGGRLMVFQVDNPWIVKLYAESASCPFGAVFCQEIFEADLIPSDTDYRVFKNLGRTPGIDMAYIQNGYVYHTKHDGANRIPIDCVKNSGANMHSFLIKLANSPYVTKPEEYKEGALIYFDYLGLFMVYYSTVVAYILNIGSCIYILLRFVIRIYLDVSVLKYDCLAILSHLIFIVFMLILNGITAYLMDLFYMQMSWYSNRLNVLGLYVLPSLILFFIYHKSLDLWPSDEIAENSHFESGKFLISVLTFTATVIGVKSSFILMLWLLFPSVLELFLNLIEDQMRIISLSYRQAIKLMMMYAVPLLYTFYLSNILFEVFIPIMGRSPYGPKPDLYIAIISAVVIILPAVTFAAKIYTTKAATLTFIRLSLTYIFLMFIFVIAFSNFGFPYNSCNDAPRKQRLSVSYLNRIFHNNSGKIIYSDSGLGLSTMDQIQFHHLKKDLKLLNGMRVASDCSNISSTDCVYHPNRNFRYFLNRKPHSLGSHLRLRVMKSSSISKSLVNVTFSLEGGCDMKLILKLNENLAAKRSSLKGTLFDNQFSMSYLCGTQPDIPLQFWLVIQANSVIGQSGKQIDYLLYSSYSDAEEEKGSVIDDFLKELPNWVVPTIDHSVYKVGRITL